MTNHLLYEGSKLERVLDRVRTDHGADASIVSADRVRRGGIGGFFTHEVFQVMVSVADVDPDESGDESGDESDRTPGASAWHTLGRIGFDDDAAAGPDGDSVDPREREVWDIVAAGAVRPTRRGAEFADALSEALAEQPRVALETEVEERPRIVSGLTRHDPPLAPGNWAEIFRGNEATHGPSSVRSTRLVVADLRSSTDASVVALRTHRLRRSIGPSSDLADLLADLEMGWVAPPALAVSGVIAVVGVRGDAERVAASLVTGVGADPADVLVAAPHQPVIAPALDELAGLAAAVRRPGGRPAVVVVEVVPGREGHEWARDVLGAIGADQVRFVVSGGRSAASQAMSVTAVGGSTMIDVVDIIDLGEADQIEAFLDLEIPVGSIDGRPATPSLWAANLLAGGNAVRRVDDGRPSAPGRSVGFAR